MVFPSRIDLSSLVDDGLGFVIQGAAASDVTGRSVSSAGDVNGDGIDDVIVGAPQNGAGGVNAGQAYVIYGTAGTARTVLNLASLAATDGFRIQGDTTSDLVGFSVSAAGDVNGDGLADILVGAVFGSNGGQYAGEAYVIYGATGTTRSLIDLSGLTATNGFIVQGDSSSDQTGRSVSGGRDINDDGIADIIIGAHTEDTFGTDDGAAYVIYGKGTATRPNIDLTGLATADGFKIFGDAPSDLAGNSVSMVGDVNGDGINDMIVGAPWGSDGGFKAGEAYVVYGKAGTTRTAQDLTGLSAADGFVIQGDQASDYAGITVSAAGDINGDGLADMIVGAFQNDAAGGNAGAAYVIYGLAGATRGRLDLSSLAATDGFAILGDAAGDQFGYSLAAAGDVNGDGIDDLVAGALQTTGAGTAYIIFGQTGKTRTTLDLTTLTSSQGVVIAGATSGDQAGFSFSGAGDVNNDGRPDIIIGARQSDLGGLNSGAAYVIYGQALGPTTGDDDLTGTGDADTIDLSAGNDTYAGLAGDDTITGGPGADSLSGGADDDTFIFATGDLATGEVIDGGDGTDTLRFLTGTHDLTGATITGIEAITLGTGAGTTLTVANLAQAALITAADGITDVVTIINATPGVGVVQAEVFFDLLGKGVETINWTGPAGQFSAALVDPNTMAITDPRGQSHAVSFTDGKRSSQTTTDTADMLDFQTLTRTYDAMGVQTSETRLLDNDVEIFTTFAGGLRTSQTTTDSAAPGQYTFQSQTRSYDSAGAVTQRELLMDNGNRVVIGGAGDNTIDASRGLDLLTGGAGADTFVFATGFTDSRISDFGNGADLLDLTAFGIDSLSALQLLATVAQIGTRVSIDLGDDVLTLARFDLANLDDSDFVLI